MTVRFGNTPDKTINSLRRNPTTGEVYGLPTAGLIVALYTDDALTTRATGLLEEDGVTVSDALLPGAGGRIPGSTVTSIIGGLLSFNAPDGTTALYYDRGDGESAVLFPQSASAASSIAYDTDGVPYVTI